MKSRGQGNSATDSYDGGTAFIVPDIRDEMNARDSLPARLRAALDYSTREFSAVQAADLVKAGQDPEYLAALIEAQTRQDHATRRQESMKCQPVRRSRNLIR